MLRSIFALILLLAGPQAWSQTRYIDPPAPLKLDTYPFTGAQNPRADQDLDCMTEEAEHAVAQYFRPYWIFDSRENARRPNEPVVLYRVQTGERRVPGRADSCSHQPKVLVLKYAYLFKDDGGFATSWICTNSHRGDNDMIVVYVNVGADGQAYTLQAVSVNPTWWPAVPVEFYQGSHPLIYLSAGKHHQYTNTAQDGQGYGKPVGCREAIDGKGARVLSEIEHPGVPHARTNVGEPWAHPLNHFVGALDVFGFTGEHAWGVTEFCGGYGKYCLDGTTISMARIWGD